jgi:hypothetical protein
MIFVVWLVCGISSLSHSHHLAAQAARVHAEEGVSEQMFVQIGGIPQWVTIKGEDRNNPVVLFLHGGPRDALSPYADSMDTGWDKSFTLVQWDQRGALQGCADGDEQRHTTDCARVGGSMNRFLTVGFCGVGRFQRVY